MNVENETGLLFGTASTYNRFVAGVYGKRSRHARTRVASDPQVARRPLLSAVVAGVLSVATNLFKSCPSRAKVAGGVLAAGGGTSAMGWIGAPENFMQKGLFLSHHVAGANAPTTANARRPARAGRALRRSFHAQHWARADNAISGAACLPPCRHRGASGTASMVR